MVKRLLMVMLTALIAFSIIPNATVFAYDENLVKGMAYTADFEFPISNAYPNLAYKDSDMKLTDGKKAPSSVTYGDSRYVQFYRGEYVNIDFVFDTEVYVNGFEAGFYTDSGAGVHSPREVYLYVSHNGEEWFQVASDIKQTRSSATTKQKVTIKAKTNDYYIARFVRIRFSSDVFVYADEIEIYGSRTGVQCKEYTAEKPEYINRFAAGNNSNIDNVRNTVLIYNGKYYKGEITDIGSATVDELLPYVAYLSKDGQIKDTMFDSVLFIPLAPGNGEYGFSKETGWNVYLENTFGNADPSSLCNMAALNEAMGRVKSKLALDNAMKLSVFITVPYIEYSTASFGKNENGSFINAASLDRRMYFIKKYIDSAVSLFNEAEFDHLDLTGFYWYHESVSFTSSNHEIELIKAYNEYVHSKGYGSIWIPYYCTPGATMWKELGFDSACMQAGYAFPKDKSSATGDPLPQSVYDAFTSAQKYGMGVEFEISSADYTRYNKYLEASAKLGNMDDGMTMYYQEGNVGVFYRIYNSSTHRYCYDNTYSYIKQTYQKGKPTLDGECTIVILKNSKNTNGKLPVNDPDTNKNDLRINSLIQPANGKVSLDGDGFFQYAPDADFSGKDSFTFTLTDNFNVSEELTVNVIVTENALRYNGDNSKMRSEKVYIYTEGASTNTEKADNEELFEVAVSYENRIISASFTNNTAIPENGFVIAASGSNAERLQILSQNCNDVMLDTVTKTLYFISADTETVDEPSELPNNNDKTENDTSNDNLVYIIIAGGVVLSAVVLVLIMLFKKGKKK